MIKKRETKRNKLLIERRKERSDQLFASRSYAQVEISPFDLCVEAESTMSVRVCFILTRKTSYRPKMAIKIAMIHVVVE
jgi:hypothetical protein